MKSIIKNELGSIEIPEELMAKMVAMEMIKFDKVIIPSNKNGSIVSKSAIFRSKDSAGVVNIEVLEEGFAVELNYIAIFGKSISDSYKTLFKSIYDCFEKLGMDKPLKITANINGIMSNRIAKRELKVVSGDGKIEVQ